MGGDLVLKQRIAKVLRLDVTERELKHRDPKQVLNSIMSKWLPVRSGTPPLLS